MGNLMHLIAMFVVVIHIVVVHGRFELEMVSISPHYYNIQRKGMSCHFMQFVLIPARMNWTTNNHSIW